MENVLEVSHLTVSYADGQRHLINSKNKIQVCSDVSFQIKKGEILGLLGESGCGKSTLAKAILGMVKITSGKITHTSAHPQMVFQDPYSSLNPSKKIGWILQEPLLIKGGYTAAQMRAAVMGMLSKVGLPENYADRYPNQLSGGQRQRVCIAAALMLEPALLIADEPVSALDVTIQAQIMKLLLELHEEMGLAILFISHDLRVVYQMSDRVMIMQKGSIVEEGMVEEVYFNPRNKYTKTLLEAAGI